MEEFKDICTIIFICWIVGLIFLKLNGIIK